MNNNRSKNKEIQKYGYKKRKAEQRMHLGGNI